MLQHLSRPLVVVCETDYGWLSRGRTRAKLKFNTAPSINLVEIRLLLFLLLFSCLGYILVCRAVFKNEVLAFCLHANSILGNKTRSFSIHISHVNRCP